MIYTIVPRTGGLSRVPLCNGGEESAHVLDGDIAADWGVARDTFVELRRRQR
jgi:hypothetical protein